MLDVRHMSVSVAEHPITVFGPDPLFSVTIEAGGRGDEVHVHAAGQGVWVARAAAELGGRPILCCLLGGETGATLDSLLDKRSLERRVAWTSGSSGSYVVDRRGGGRSLVAASLRRPPRRHEIDDLVSATSAAASDSALLVMCNPYPPDGFPEDVYETVAANVKALGVPVIVDLSPPRLDRTLGCEPDLVKCNDWELAQYVCGPVEGRQALDAARRVCGAGARAVAVTRGEGPILVVPADDEPFEVVPPPLPRGFREGCGDTMMGAVAAGWTRGLCLREALVLGAAAGAINFLRRGLGTGTRASIEELAPRVMVRPLRSAASIPAA
jgi:1-phosphofructokinase